MFKRLIIAALCLGLVPGAAMAAEEWVALRADRAGALSIDVNGVSRDGDVASGWVRGELRRRDRTPSGKRYATAMFLMQFNCPADLERTAAIVYLDDKGQRVDSSEGAATWDKIKEDTLDMEMSNAMCLISMAEGQGDIRAGTWRSVDRDKASEMSLLQSQIVQITEDEILVLARQDHAEYHLMEGVPYRHVITATAFDCRRRLAAPVRSEYFLDWNRRLYVEKVAPADIKFGRIAPGTYAYALLDELCAAPHVQRSDALTSSDGGMSVGTAWATNKGYLVTASHVVTGGKTIAVYQNSQKVGEAVVVGNDPANDVAVLRYVPAGGGKIRIIPLADKAGVLGKAVFTLGFPAPDVMGQSIKMSAGDISGTSGIQDDARFMQISMPIQEGNSGGPVIGFDGSAVGVVSAKLAKLSEDRDAPKPENVNYAVKIAYVRPLLEELPDLKDWIPIKVVGGSTEDLIAQAREAVFMLVVTP